MPIFINELQIKANPQQAILSLEQRVALLESVLQVSTNNATLSFGGSTITLSATGNVTITGREVSIVSSAKTIVKSSGEIAMKAAKINQN